MSHSLKKFAVLSLSLLASAALAQTKQVMGVSIPSADHGWTGGVVYWANETKKSWKRCTRT